MARKARKKQNKKRTRGGWIALKILAVMLIMMGITLGYAYFNASTVHVRYAEITLKDLPDVFDGSKVLFVSDIDLCGTNSPEKSAKLMQRLQALQPDMLLLGGDYTSTSIIDVLNQTENESGALTRRNDFFKAIAGFNAPLGKYAVAGDNDVQLELLESLFRETGVTPLFNDHSAVKKGNGTIHLVGFNANISGVNFGSVANAFKKEDCVIVLAHSPGVFPQVLTTEASNMGAWADLLLAGHTHGGQIRLMGRNIIRLSDQEQNFLKGWKRENDSLLLTSTGLGCEGANLRLGSQPEVWMITLKNGNVILPDLSI